MSQSGRLWPGLGRYLKCEKRRRIGETYSETVSQKRAATAWSSVARLSNYGARGTVREAAEETVGARNARPATRIIPSLVVQCRWLVVGLL
jgi:hypothetical protein